MASRHRVSCIEKDSSGDRITHIGGKNDDGTSWKLTERQAIEGIEADKWTFYVERGGSSTDVIVVKMSDGTKYLRTKPDGNSKNGLLDLPTCS